MQQVDTLITGGLILPSDEAFSQIADGAVAIAAGRIAAIGPTAEITAAYTAPDVIDATDHLVMPGLINAHVHSADALFRSLIGDMPLEPWLEQLWVAEKAYVRPDTVRLAARLAYAEMIRGGITAALDMYWFPEESARVAREVGFRLATGPIYFDMPEPDGIPITERTTRARDFLDAYAADPLITPIISPHSTYTVSPRYLEEAAALAAEYGIGLHTHAAETAAEVADVVERFGATPIGHLDALGLLGERTVLAHCVHVTPAEIELLAARGVSVAHCPVCNLKMGSGIAPVPAMRAAGVRVLLGTDGPVSSNDLDLWTAMRFAAVLHRGLTHDPTFHPPAQVVRMVTADAARGLGLGLGEVTGSLEVGRRADIILLDLQQPHLMPLYDAPSYLAYSAGRDDVTTVLIDGQVVMRDRQLQTIDLPATLAEVAALGATIGAAMRPA
jgi:5-methylthioadenosine/S-adenosylhomocysteine deaminase